MGGIVNNRFYEVKEGLFSFCRKMLAPSCIWYKNRLFKERRKLLRFRTPHDALLFSLYGSCLDSRKNRTL